MKAVVTSMSKWGVEKITEDMASAYGLTEMGEQDFIDAKEEGYRFAHLYEEKEDELGGTYYEFVTSVILR